MTYALILLLAAAVRDVYSFEFGSLASNTDPAVDRGAVLLDAGVRHIQRLA
jgi:hypothetical protein